MGTKSRKSVNRAEQDKLRLLLAKARQKAGLSARQLSLQLGYAPTFIARLERGERTIDVVEYLDVCKAIGLDPVATLKRLVK